MKIVGEIALKFPAGYGLALTKCQNAIFFGRSPKPVRYHHYDTLYKVWMKSNEIGRGAEF